MYDAIVVGARVAGAPLAMLLARRGYAVLLADKASFPSDTMSTHYIHQPGNACLKRWGLLDRVVATGCPAIRHGVLDPGGVTLRGWGPAAEGVEEAYAPRRTVLDKILVDGAADAGVEVRERFAFQDLLFDGESVTGIRGRTAAGATVAEQARIVIGADGMHSAVARAVNAATYNTRPALACYYYSYFSGVPMPDLELYPREGRIALGFPTNDDLVVIGVGWRNEEFHAFRSDIDGNFQRTLEQAAPSLAARVRGGRREERWTGTADLPNFFRRPWGPGWALVGDAGYHRDPITGYGITDAFRDAELLADAVHTGLSGAAPMATALSAYEERRNEAVMAMYDMICGMASLRPLDPAMQALFAALEHNAEDTNRMFGVLDGTVPVTAFFAPDNIGRIMAAGGVAA
ncbi:MAG: NAD(P)/FAD-dependent oxidoreductase [Dehalococcoidia bacterium]